MKHLPQINADQTITRKKTSVPGIGTVNPLRGFLEAAHTGIYSPRGVKEPPRYPPFEAFREIERKNPIVSSCVNLRRRQIRPYMEVSPDDNIPGFRVKLKDITAKPSAKEKKEIAAIQEWFLTAGRTDFPGWEDREDNIHDAVVKMVREYLVIDRVAVEIRRDRKGNAVDFWMLDGTTIRRVIDAGFKGSKNDIDPRAFIFADDDYYKKLAEARIDITPDFKEIRFVQVIQDRIVAAFTRRDLIFDSLQKVVDINRSGHGYGPTEQALAVITTFLWGMVYNSEQFNSGTLPKIALAFEEGKFGVEELISLQDEFIANQRGPGGVWRVPMLNGKVNVLDLYKSPRDLEFRQGMEFWGSLICSIFGVDSQELGLRFAQAQNVMNENQDARQKFSKDRGLHDLLGGVQNVMNKIMILSGWGNRYKFCFTGISPDDKEQVSKLDTEKVKRHLTVNEYRKTQDLEPIEGGDVILDPTFLQSVQGAAMGSPEEGAEEFSEEDSDSVIDESLDDLFKARSQKSFSSFRTVLTEKPTLKLSR